MRHPRRDTTLGRPFPLSRSGLMMLLAVIAALGTALLLPSTPAFSQPEVAGGDEAAQETPPTPVRVASVSRETVKEMRRITGELAARRRAVVASEESGLVLDVPVDDGQFVTRGDLLARLDADLLQLEMAEAEALVSEARASIEEEQANVGRWEREVRSLEDLAARDAAQPKQLADARDDLRVARARLSVAEQSVNVASARVNRLARRLRSARILAPFDGVIVTKRTEVGEWVSEGGAIVELIERGRADAVLEVPERLVNLVTLSMPVKVILATGEHLTGSVRAVIPEGNPRARTYPVKVEIADADGRLKPGMSVSAWLPTGELTDAMTVPKDAVIESPTGSFVYVIRGPVATPADVEVLASAGGERVVVSTASLRPGDQVVIEGNERLYPGAMVSAVGGDSDAAGSGGSDSRSPSGQGPEAAAPASADSADRG